jgi:hypothetical protein
MADGRLVRDASEFVALHRDWFTSPTWSLGTELVDIQETPDMGPAVIRLEYRDRAPDGRPIREASLLTLAFARRGDGWVMIHDQNTPIKGGPAESADGGGSR